MALLHGAMLAGAMLAGAELAGAALAGAEAGAEAGAILAGAKVFVFFAHPPISPICRTPLFPYLTLYSIFDSWL